ncbi:hypothetical protein [Streptomyces sp. NPDC002215]|uniref:hypothetical protein n=1 Tax=Streptomyces sp. NPDC002215 TaxID=3154412 RepID=UPI0033233623
MMGIVLLSFVSSSRGYRRAGLAAASGWLLALRAPFAVEPHLTAATGFGAVPGDIAFVGDGLAVLADDDPGVEPGR